MSSSTDIKHSNPDTEPALFDGTESLADIFKIRTKIDSAIYNAIRDKAVKLIELVPDELREWQKGEFPDADFLAHFILRDNMCLIFGRSIKIFTIDEGCPYGAKDKNDAAEKFAKLRKAWKGLMDVEFINDENQGLRLILKFPGTQGSLHDTPSPVAINK